MLSLVRLAGFVCRNYTIIPKILNATTTTLVTALTGKNIKFYYQSLMRWKLQLTSPCVKIMKLF